jgi:hypothetical protein
MADLRLTYKLNVDEAKRKIQRDDERPVATEQRP